MGNVTVSGVLSTGDGGAGAEQHLKETPWWLLAGIVIMGAGVRLFQLGRDMLTFDETFTADAARRSPSDLLAYLRAHDNHPPLDYLMRHWLAVGGASDFAMRFPSVVLSVAALAVIGTWLKPYGRLGTIVSVLVAVGSFQVSYGRQARMYAGLELAGVIAAWASWRWLGRPTVEEDRLAVSAAALAVLAALLLQSAALLLVPGILLIPGWRRDRSAWSWRAGVMVAVAVWAILWGPSFVTQLGHTRSSWVPLARPSYVSAVLSELVTRDARLRIGVLVLIGVGAVLLPAGPLRRVWWLLGAVPCGIACGLGIWMHILLPRSLAFAAWAPLVALGVLVDRAVSRSVAVGAGLSLLIAIVVVPSTVDVLVTSESAQAPALQFVHHVARSGEAVVISPAFLAPTVRWYFGEVWHRGGAAMDRTDLAASGVVVGPLSQADRVSRTGRVWLVQSAVYPVAAPGRPRCAPPRPAGEFTVFCLAEP